MKESDKLKIIKRINTPMIPYVLQPEEWEKHKTCDKPSIGNTSIENIQFHHMFACHIPDSYDCICQHEERDYYINNQHRRSRALGLLDYLINGGNNHTDKCELEYWWYTLSYEYVFFGVRGERCEDDELGDLPLFIIHISLFKAIGGERLFGEDKRLTSMEKITSSYIERNARALDVGLLKIEEVPDKFTKFGHFQKFFYGKHTRGEDFSDNPNIKKIKIPREILPSDEYIFYRGDKIHPDLQVMINSLLLGNLSNKGCYDPSVYMRDKDKINYSLSLNRGDISIKKSYPVIEDVSDHGYHKTWVFISLIDETDLLGYDIDKIPLLILELRVYRALGNEFLHPRFDYTKSTGE